MLDELRRYIADMPILADLLQQAVYQNRGTATNAEEQRYHLEELHAGIMKRLKEERRLYGVTYNPDIENHCPVCRKTFMGSYFEINNAATGKAIVSSMRLVHALVEHEQTFFQELMVNVTGTRVGEMRLTLDLKAIRKVMEGADVPAEVLQEAEQAVEVQKQQLAEAGDLAASGGH